MSEAEKPLRYAADWIARKKQSRRIVVVTAYDAAFARLVARSRVDAILVGDSLSMVVQGHRSTIPVTLDEMIYHAQMVRRGAPDAFVIGDLSFGSFQKNMDQAIESAIRMVKEGGVNAVKMEGAEAHVLDAIRHLTTAGVPVMGHTGLKPQTVMTTGGYRVQGRSETEKKLEDEARALCQAGCFAMIFELVVSAVATRLSKDLPVPVIGIGSGAGTDGQVLVLHDLLGIDDSFQARHVKRYVDLAGLVTGALNEFGDEVRRGDFPGDEHSFS